MEELLVSEKAKPPFYTKDRMFLTKALPSLWKRSSIAMHRGCMNGKCFATVASSSDYDEVMNLVKSAILYSFTSRQRSIDYFYAGCMIPECMKVPFFVAVFIQSSSLCIAMLQHRGCSSS